MYLSVRCFCLVADILQFAHRCRINNSYLSSKVADSINTSKPYDVFDVNVISYQHFFVFIDVDNANKTIALLTEIVQER